MCYQSKFRHDTIGLQGLASDIKLLGFISSECEWISNLTYTAKIFHLYNRKISSVYIIQFL